MQSCIPRILALGFFASHFQYALLWVLESLLQDTGKSNKKEKGRHTFFVAKRNGEGNISQTPVGNYSLWPFSFTKAESLNVVSSQEITEGEHFPPPFNWTDCTLNNVTLQFFSPLLQYYGSKYYSHQNSTLSTSLFYYWNNQWRNSNLPCSLLHSLTSTIRFLHAGSQYGSINV